MIEVRPVRYTEILDAANSAALMSEYAAECSIPEIGEARPQRELYARMEKSGMMHCLGVFYDDEMVGFASMLFYVMPHYGKKVAYVESIFVAREHRINGIGVALMKDVEEAAKDADCVAILYTAPAGSQLEKLLTLQQDYYRRTNSVFTRRLQ